MIHPRSKFQLHNPSSSTSPSRLATKWLPASLPFPRRERCQARRRLGTIINLIAYRARQRWARRRTQTTPSPASLTAMRTTRCPQADPCAGMPNWEVNRVDEEIHITHRGTGKYIVLRYDGQDFLLPHDVRKSMPPNSPLGDIRGRLAAAAPVRGLEAAVEELVVARSSSWRVTSSYHFKWNDIVERTPAGASGPPGLGRRARASFCRLWDNPDNRLWLAAAIGDWPTAKRARPVARRSGRKGRRGPKSSKHIGSDGWRSPVSTLAWSPIRWTICRFFTRRCTDDFNVCVNRAIATTGVNWDLADLLAATGNPQWNPQLFVQFERLCTDHGIFEPMLANLLLERSYRGGGRT